MLHHETSSLRTFSTRKIWLIPRRISLFCIPQRRVALCLAALLAWEAKASVVFPTVRADYQFQNTLQSSVSGSPPLANLGPNTFGSANVDGSSRTILNFAANDGLSLSTSGVIPGGSYSIVILFAFDQVSGYRRILDFKSASSDTGLYLLGGNLNFYNEAIGSVGPIAANLFVQVVLTRDFSQNVVGYVNGVQQFSFVDSSGLAALDSGNILRFFRDEDPVFPNEASAGSVARIRLYDSPLGSNDVAALDRLPGTMGFSISGSVRDANGLSVSGVAMHLTGDQTRTLFTDSTGFYYFSSVPAGNYQLAPNLAGYVFSPMTVTHAPLATNVIDNFTAISTGGSVATVQFVRGSFGQTEGFGPALVEVERLGNTSTPVTVQWAAVDGTATAGADFGSSNGAIDFAPGQTNQTFLIDVIDDGLVERTEHLRVELSDPINATLGSLSNTFVFLFDNDFPVRVEFSSDNFYGSEGASPALVTIERLGNVYEPFSVQWAITGGAAMPGNDYLGPGNGSVNFASGEPFKNIELILIDDQIVEPSEAVELELRNPTNALLGVVGSTTLTIFDNDIIPQPGTGTFTVTREGVDLVICWPAAFPEFFLLETSSLNPPIQWRFVPERVMVAADRLTVRTALEEGQRFFRLVYSALPLPPSGLRIVAEDERFLVSWDAVPNATSYNLYLHTTTGVSQHNYLALFPGLTNRFEAITDLIPGTRYYFVVAANNSNGTSTDSSEATEIFGPRGDVLGSIFTVVQVGTNEVDVPLPDVAVYLENLATSVQTPPQVTDANGFVTFSAQAMGSYRLCWDATGFISGCSTQQVVVEHGPVHLFPERIYPLANSVLGLVFGRVSLGGRSAFQQNAFLDINVRPVVTLRRSQGAVLRTATVNELGDYVFWAVPREPSLILSAQAEGALVATNVNTFDVGQANLILPNTAPVITRLYAIWNGREVKRAPPGATVQLYVEAQDADGDQLHFRWVADHGADGFASVDANTVALTMPSTPGPVQLFARVNDGRGGYAARRLNLAAETNVVFTGYLCDTNSGRITNGVVRINAHETVTDTNGFFALDLPALEETYSLTAFAEGYAPVFRHYTDSSTETVYYLRRATLLCTNWSGQEMQFSDADGTAMHLESNSLVDGQGQSYLGSICVEIATYDPCDSSTYFPAGNRALDELGAEQLLMPQATAFIRIEDAAGSPLFLRAGQPALVRLPLGPTCPTPAGEPSVQPGWLWDETDAIWRPAGQVIREFNGGVFSFVGRVIQLGLMAVGTPMARTKVTLQICESSEADRTLNVPFQIRVSSLPNPVTVNVDDSPSTQIEVPRNKEITFEVLNPKEAPGEYFANPNDPATRRKLEDKTVIVRLKKTFTGEAADLNLSLSNHIAEITSARVEGNNRFLTFRSTGRMDGGRFDPVDAYYRAIDFPRQGNSFATWLKKNAFLPPNGRYPADYREDAAALYFNATDLGFARFMHMKTKPGMDGQTDIAYYVVNYRSLEDALADRPDKPLPPERQALATVAMDYAFDARLKKRYTKFYVFDFGSAENRPMRPDADLDNSTGKPVPNLCVNCHGTKPINVTVKRGQYEVSPEDGDVGGRFIPFDMESFTYAKDLGVQKDEFRKLNRGIYLHTAMSPAMKELIEGWYGGPLTAQNNNPFSTTFIPTGWNAEAAVYRDVVKISCRGCHTMRSGNIAFNTFAGFKDFAGRADRRVCADFLMPNAQRTFSIFWGSKSANVIKPGSVPDQAETLKKKFDWKACPTP